MSEDTVKLQGYFRWKEDKKPTYLKVRGTAGRWRMRRRRRRTTGRY